MTAQGNELHAILPRTGTQVAYLLPVKQSAYGNPSTKLHCKNPKWSGKD